jgi:hypothetical protein
MKYDVKRIHKILEGILEWKEEEKDTQIYKEIQVLTQILELDLKYNDY